MVDHKQSAITPQQYVDKLNSRECDTHMQDCIDHLIRAAFILSPSLEVKQAFTQIERSMQANNETNVAIVRALLCTMFDGIAVGNWPDNNDCDSRTNRHVMCRWRVVANPKRVSADYRRIGYTFCGYATAYGIAEPVGANGTRLHARANVYLNGHCCKETGNECSSTTSAQAESETQRKDCRA